MTFRTNTPRPGDLPGSRDRSPVENPVNPAHYQKAGGIETIDYIEAVTIDVPGDEAVSLANVIKYVSRYRQKHPTDPTRDLRKAAWYLQRLTEIVEGKLSALAPSVEDLVDDFALADTVEGDKLRIRSVMLCKDRLFQTWIGVDNEEEAAEWVRLSCGVFSRGELTHNRLAQRRFLHIERGFRADNPYTDEEFKRHADAQAGA